MGFHLFIAEFSWFLDVNRTTSEKGALPGMSRGCPKVLIPSENSHSIARIIGNIAERCFGVM
jgi:hypothetical protein